MHTVLRPEGGGGGVATLIEAENGECVKMSPHSGFQASSKLFAICTPLNARFCVYVPVERFLQSKWQPKKANQIGHRAALP